MQTIAIDVDDVLAQHFELMKMHFLASYRVHLTHGDARSNLLAQIEPSRHSLVIDDIDKFVTSPAFYVEPLQGAIDTVKILMQDYRLVIITARPLSARHMTTEWLNLYFGNAFDYVEFVGAEKWGRGHVAQKDHLYDKHGVDYLIDDSLSHCVKAVGSGVQPLLFGDYGWNTSESETEGIVRVSDWDKARLYFDGRC